VQLPLFLIQGVFHLSARGTLPQHRSLYVSSSLKNEIDKHEHSSISVSISLKNETYNHDHSSLSVSRSLRNEIDPPPIESSLPLDVIHEPSFPPPMLVDHLTSSLSGEPIAISNHESNRLQKKSQRMK
jgi:hypothetical protein